jgi:enoyl-CoA hydratase/carnithine racemase
MSEPVLCKKEGDVLTITLNRSEDGNRINNDMATEIRDHINNAVDVKVILLRAVGKDFCAGRDMPKPLPGQYQTALEKRATDTEPALALFKAMQEAKVPIICAVSGATVGIGCAIAAAADITIASDTAHFQLPEMAKGIPPCLALSALLGKVTNKAIMHLVYSGDPLGADDAYATGFVSRVVQDAQLETEVTQLVNKISGYTDAAVNGVKEFMGSAIYMDSAARASYASNLAANVFSSSRD